MSRKTAPDRITLTFDLQELPSAQHRAGLAGLILQIDSMESAGYKRSPNLVPIIEEITPTSATITFSRESMQSVFDDLYAAEIKEIVVANKWPGATRPKPGEFFIEKKDPKTGEMKRSPGFAYDVVQPLAPCLRRHLQESAVAWLNLWREMIWSIPRGGNNVLSRAPFTQKANKPTEPCGEGATAWVQIQDLQKKREAAQSKTDAISGALLLGAQSVNAEAVPFSGRVDHNLLLHFWQVVVLTFVPQVVSKKDAKIERFGYVLTIPDVADLREFRRAFPVILGSLKSRQNDHIPSSARIELPAQANLEVLRRLKGGEDSEPSQKRVNRTIRRDGTGHSDGKHVQHIATSRAQQEDWSGSVRAIESYHMLKLGNNIKMLSFERIAGKPDLVDDYTRINSSFRNPLFRASLMRARIREDPWHAGLIELFAEYPSPFFIEGEDTPRYLPRFGRDVRDQLHAFHKDLFNMKLAEMNEEERLKHLSLILQRLVYKYVEGRAEVKTGKKVKEFPKKTINDREFRDYPKEFREAQQRVCSDAFLAMRSRHDQDFVEFFAGSICSVAQFLPAEDYQFLIQILMAKPDANPVGRRGLCWEDVKAMAMIAVSACSFQVRPRDTEPQGSPS
jgi:hypothetical protein